MNDPNRIFERTDERLTSAELASRTGDPGADMDTANFATDPAVDTSFDPKRPRLVRSENLAAREWDAPPTTTDRLGTMPAGTVVPLFSDTDVVDLQSRWSNVQAGFVDEPRRSVEEADQLVATVMQRLAEGFANERASLEKQWDSGDNVSTEDLRVALQRYRAFFGRLLNAA
jgi:hypothetical protein